MQFYQAANDVQALADEAQEVRDACITLWVHAGIAAADVLCCRRLGEHATGDNHNFAVGVLKKVDAQLAKSLKTLLDLKTPAGYSAARLSDDDAKRAARAAGALVEAAQSVR